jgi:hypothetical protein
MFYLLIVFVFIGRPAGFVEDMSDRQVQVYFEPTKEACGKEAAKMLAMQTPASVVVGVKCDGPFTDPTKVTLSQ